LSAPEYQRTSSERSARRRSGWVPHPANRRLPGRISERPQTPSCRIIGRTGVVGQHRVIATSRSLSSSSSDGTGSTRPSAPRVGVETRQDPVPHLATLAPVTPGDTRWCPREVPFPRRPASAPPHASILPDSLRHRTAGSVQHHRGDETLPGGPAGRRISGGRATWAGTTGPASTTVWVGAGADHAGKCDPLPLAPDLARMCGAPQLREKIGRRSRFGSLSAG
jgi:hypothetical protein